VKDTTDKAKETGTKAKDTAEGAAGSAGQAVSGELLGPIKEQLREAAAQAARDILAPAAKQASDQAIAYAAQRGPELVKEQMPAVLKSFGVDKPQDLIKGAVGKVGESISDSGGITGIAGKLMSKVGRKGGKGGQATGYGVKRRMPVQQDMFVGLPVDLVYTAWTEYSRWTEYMFRANTVDADYEKDEGGKGRVKVVVKMWGFKRPFTAEVTEQHPDEYIRWRAVDGTKNTGVISFHELAPRLTLVSVNIDHGPSGPIEKIARGARFDKRQIRSDLHRFKGWAEHLDAEDLEEIEGWRGTIEDGEIVKTHEEAMAEQDEEEPDQPDTPTEAEDEEEPTEPTEGDEDEDLEPVAEEGEEEVEEATPEDEDEDEGEAEAPEDEEEPVAEEEPDDEEEEKDEEPEAEEEPEETDNGGYSWDDLSEMERSELREVIADEGLGIKVARKDTDDVRVEVAKALEVEMPEEVTT